MSESTFQKNKYGVARDDLDLRAKIALSNWRPIGLPIQHHLDPRIAELEAKAKQQALDDELREAGDDFEKRELIVLKQRRRADFAAQDAKLERDAHLATVKSEVEFLRGLRDKLAADPERSVSEIVRVDQALAQYEVQGVPKSHGDKLLAEIKQREAERVAAKKKSLLDQRLTLNAELAKLDAAIDGKPAPETVKIQVAAGSTLAERNAAVQQHLKASGNTVRLIEFFESEDNSEARQKILDEFSEVVEPESTVVVDGDGA